jgi:hypothetical protein
MEHICGNGVTTAKGGAPGNMGVIFDKGFSDETNVFFIDFFVD